MKRLTGYDYIAGVKTGDLLLGVDPQAAFHRLAAYEDTGLDPDEITVNPYPCVFYCNRRCNLDDDWCIEAPGCPNELSKEDVNILMDFINYIRGQK